MTALFKASFARRFAEILLDVKAVQINTKKPYTWSSGKKFPIYCDNRRLLSEVSAREEVKKMLIQGVSANFSKLRAIAAVATAGIPYGAMMADALRLPFGYLRPEPKAHGLGKRIEGNLSTSDPVLLFEDLVSTGGSLCSAAAALQEAGYRVIGAVALFSYNLGSQVDVTAEVGCPLYLLTRFEELVPVAEARGLIQPKEGKLLSDLLRSS